MITNKDVRVENGNIVINGDKYPLDGQSPATIMEIVSENSDTTPTESSIKPITSGGVYTAIDTINDTIGDITQTGVTGADVAAQLGVLGAVLTFTHFVQIPYSTSILDSIKTAFTDGTIPIDLTGITIGTVAGAAGGERALFIAQNQSVSDSLTRFSAIYFGTYMPPHYCYKQDSAAWVDTAL